MQISVGVAEKLQVIPAQYIVERIKKPVMACPCCKQSAPVKAASPDSVLLAQQILTSGLVHIDETPCVGGVRDGTRTRCKNNSFFWPIVADGMVVFHYTGDRRHNNVEEILGKNLQGIIMNDGYDAYRSYAAGNPEVTMMNGINIHEYLTDLLSSLGDKPPSELTPIAWAKARR